MSSFRKLTRSRAISTASLSLDAPNEARAASRTRGSSQNALRTFPIREALSPAIVTRPRRDRGRFDERPPRLAVATMSSFVRHTLEYRTYDAVPVGTSYTSDVRWLPALTIGVLTAAIIGAPVAARPAPDARLRTSGASARQDELPDGEGKKILMASCTSCHDLTEVTKFRGYYDKKQWRDIVVTMQEYGAPIEAKQIDTLADYLVLHLGRK